MKSGGFPETVLRRFRYMDALWKAAYSKDLYRHVAQHWPGWGLTYLWLLLAVAWVPEIAKIHFQLVSEINKHGEALVRQFPVITIRNGVATVDPPGIHKIRNPENNEVVVIIDTTGEHNSLEGTEALALVTENKVHLLNKSRKEIRIHDLSRFEEIVDRVDPDILRGWLSYIKGWTSIILFLLFVPFSFLYRLIQVLFYAVLAMPFSRFPGSKLDYGAVVRISAVAITVPVFLETARSLIGEEIPFWWFICFGIATAYIHFGLKAVAAVPVTPEAMSTANQSAE